MKVLFLQSAHLANDDRVWYHQAAALQEKGIDVEVCGKEQFADFQIDNSDADIIIADTPRALWKAGKSKAKLVYDITEWYPSKKNLRGLHRLGRWTKAFAMCLASLWAGWRSDAFIFGEYYKSVPFRRLFPHTPFINLPYYPDLQYITPTAPHDISRCCKILYAGPLTQEKGYFRVLEVAEQVRKMCPNTQIQLDIISNDTPTDNPHPDSINYSPALPFKEFCKAITQYDIFLDLRDNDAENTHCLPIKLFYYMACGRPSIYANLKAIQKGVPEVMQCAYLADSVDDVARAVVRYIQDPALYASQCAAAHTLSETKYHWEAIQNSFLQLMHSLHQN